MTDKTLSTLLPMPGWDPRHAGEVEIAGGTDPILPTPFRIGETAAASLAAVCLAVSNLWELRTGRRQEIKVDTRQATASLRSSRYLTMDGSPTSGPLRASASSRGSLHGYYLPRGTPDGLDNANAANATPGAYAEVYRNACETSPSRPSSSGGTAR